VNAAANDYAGWYEDQDLRRHLAILPAPADFASELSSTVRAALISAFRAADGWRCNARQDAQLLRPYGLCDMTTLFLTNFGTSVRAAIVDGTNG
jgi:hypothetical protein